MWEAILQGDDIIVIATLYRYTAYWNLNFKMWKENKIEKFQEN